MLSRHDASRDKYRDHRKVSTGAKAWGILAFGWVCASDALTIPLGPLGDRSLPWWVEPSRAVTHK